MKPYFRVTWNMIKFNLKRIFRCNNLNISGLLMFGYNTKISVCKSSHVTLGRNIVSDGRCVMIVDQDAKIEIGDRCYFNEGMMISAKESVVIGAGCQFGPNVKIFDNNHCFNKEQGVLEKHSSSGINIGKNCWIAANVTILKGTSIGDNCVIGTGCVVKGLIPSSSIVTQESKLKITKIEDRKL